MKVKDLLRHLSCYKPDDEIIALWWDRDSYYDHGFTVEEWNSIVQNLEDNSWDGVADDVTAQITEVAAENGYGEFK